LTLFFYVTPVLWRMDFVPPKYRPYFLLNPFVSYLEILRQPLLNAPAQLENWIIAGGISFVGLLFTLPLVGRYRHRIIFWL
jgi:ABC-type polysaccharide/polyol phosphate export permease